MRGEIRLVVDRLVREVWLPVAAMHTDRDQVGGVIFSTVAAHMLDLYTPQEGDGPPDKPLVNRAADCADSYELATDELETISPDDFKCELDVVEAVTGVWDALDEFDDQAAIDSYVDGLVQFVDRYSLRYYVGSRAELSATFPGLATTSFHEFRKICVLSGTLNPLLIEFEHALAEAVDDPMESRIKTAFAKLFNLMEAAAALNPKLGTPPEKPTFGELCKRLKVWPHSAILDSVCALYEFANEYPGVRHAGKAAARKRPVAAADLLGICSALISFTPYLVEDVPDSAGLRLERRVRANAEACTSSSRSW